MKAFNNNEFEAYREEARDRWGKTDAYMEHSGKTKHYSKEKWNCLAEEMEAILEAFGICLKTGAAPGTREVQILVKKLQNYITANYYACTNEVLTGLGQMYIADDRFKRNIDKHGEGTAAFIGEAIAVYCKK